MDAQDYIDELQAKKRRNRIIGVVIAVILAALILPGLFKKDGFTREDLENTLVKVPELALTQAEHDLANTILEPDTFRSKLTYDLTGSTAFTFAEVEAIIAPVVPADAEILDIFVQGAVVCIDFQTEHIRTILEYVDADRSGSVDQIRKSVAPLEPQPEPFAPKSLAFYQISYDIRTEETKLLAVEDFS